MCEAAAERDGAQGACAVTLCVPGTEDGVSFLIHLLLRSPAPPLPFAAIPLLPCSFVSAAPAAMSTPPPDARINKLLTAFNIQSSWPALYNQQGVRTILDFAKLSDHAILQTCPLNPAQLSALRDKGARGEQEDGNGGEQGERKTTSERESRASFLVRAFGRRVHRGERRFRRTKALSPINVKGCPCQRATQEKGGGSRDLYLSPSPLGHVLFIPAAA